MSVEARIQMTVAINQIIEAAKVDPHGEQHKLVQKAKIKELAELIVTIPDAIKLFRELQAPEESNNYI